MNKTAIKNYAVWARNELIERVTRKAFEYEVTKDNKLDGSLDIINGKPLTIDEKKQRQELIKVVNEKGFDQVMEEVAYTWFNRFIALRFMEVNNYLPKRVRIFTNENNEFKPQILDEAMNVDLDNLDKVKVFNLLQANARQELYKELLIATCNDMGNYLPGMFTKISDYKVLLFPDNLLNEDSVVGKMVTNIDEDSWIDTELDNESSNGITIIGWLYQYYISERHNQVVNILKGTVKKEDIPAATQLWTTDWVVRYMVDNSLGRYWVERNPESPLKEKLTYLATSKNNELPYIDERVNPEDITFLDPCMGSGHILVYAFDVLMEIYKECGYSERDAALNIVQNNLYGLDIDDRAYQLSYFAVMMKTRKYNRRALTMDISNNLASIQESNTIENFNYEGMNNDDKLDQLGEYLVQVFKDAKETGSLITVKEADYKSLYEYIINLKNKYTEDIFAVDWKMNVLPQMEELCKQAIILSKKYTICTTNPPYMNKLEGNLKPFVIKNYKDYSSDLFAVFMRRNFDFTIDGGYLGFMTPFVWMFIKSYEKLREYIINNKSIATLVQMEYSAYEEATVPICSFVLKNQKDDKPGYYYRLSDFKGGMEVQKQKVLEAQSNKQCGYFYETVESNFSKIPGRPIAYWFKCVNIFDEKTISKYYESAGRNKTHNNPLYVRLWWEIFDNNRWQPYANGGEYRKWYGNHNDVVDWSEKAKNEYASHGGLYNQKYSNKKGICWNLITSATNGFRIKNKFEHYSSAAPTIISDTNKDDYYILGFLNSKVSIMLLNMFNPTLNTTVGDVLRLPIKFINEKEIVQSVSNNIELSKQDWDSFETSWDFIEHPLVRWGKSLWDCTAIRATMCHYYGDKLPEKVSGSLELCYLLWQGECDQRFNQLKANEEELNRIFIDIYGLNDELDPYVEDKDITVRKADLNRDIRSFISYAVGCMFGRYSLNVEGLAFAGGEWDNSKYSSFIPDEDNIIPICDDEYFEDDIVGRFVKFVEVVYGSETLEENLTFIASALGGKGTSREVIRNYFLNEFYNDHCKIYQKRPIYWLFDSGKKNGFKALIYLHRYSSDLIARLRTKYVFNQQSRYRNQIEMVENQLGDDMSSSERVRLNKRLKALKEQDEELRKYEEVVHHYADQMITIDLDDGVKVNYDKFKDLLGKIK